MRVSDLLVADDRDAARFRAARATKGTVDYLRWRLNRRLGPPPSLFKRRAIRFYRARFGTPTFIETGTYLGDTVACLLGKFESLYSIELSEEMFRAAARRFELQDSVTVLCGDSGIELPKILSTLTRPALIWLDAHWSGGSTARGLVDSPVDLELRAALGTPLNHVILIDDAREFTGHDGYPTVEQIRDFVHSARPDYGFLVKDDMIRITPPRVDRRGSRVS